MKSFIGILSVIVFLPATAFAQTSDPDAAVIPELRLDGVPAEITACVRACAAGRTPGADCLPASAAERSSRAAAAGSAARRMRSRASDVRRRITALETEVGVLRTGSGDLAGRITALETEVARLGRETHALERYYRLVVEDYVDLAARTEVHNELINGLRADVDALSARVDRLESRNGIVGLGVRAGGILLYSFDSTLYSGFNVGPRVSLRLTHGMTLNLDAQFLLSASESPVGTRIRGGWTWQFHDNVELGIGVSASWVGYNSRLEAKSAFIGADVGLAWRPLEWFVIGADAFGGAEFDQDDPSPAIGGLLWLGLDLPSL